jgi:TonB family protein
MSRGARLLEAGDIRGAVEAFKAATKKQKENAEAWNSLGVAQFRNNNFKEARKAFERAVKIRPDFASPHIGLAYVLQRTGKFNDAVRKAQQALTLDPRNPEAYYVIGAVRLSERKFTEVLNQAEMALKVSPDYAPALLQKMQAFIGLCDQRISDPKLFRKTGDSPLKDAKELRAARYQYFKQAAESLEAYLKLRPAADTPHWRERLETLRVYAEMAEEDSGEKDLAAMDEKLRPTILYREKARYTETARQNRVQGSVVMMVVFASDGQLKHLLVLRGLPDGLTEQAIAAARKIRFTPAMRNGRPISVVGTLDFSFNLY